ncbi:MAG: hypothetical protein AAAC47_26945, partial [Pararhizobium sp.]
MTAEIGRHAEIAIDRRSAHHTENCLKGHLLSSFGDHLDRDGYGSCPTQVNGAAQQLHRASHSLGLLDNHIKPVQRNILIDPHQASGRLAKFTWRLCLSEPTYPRSIWRNVPPPDLAAAKGDLDCMSRSLPFLREVSAMVEEIES